MSRDPLDPFDPLAAAFAEQQRRAEDTTASRRAHRRAGLYLAVSLVALLCAALTTCHGGLV